MRSSTNNYETCLLAENPKILSFIDYQIVYQLNEMGMVIKSINFLTKGKIIKKVYLKPAIQLDAESDFEAIILKILFPDYDQTNKKSKRDNRSKAKPNKDARFQAANELFTNLGL